MVTKEAEKLITRIYTKKKKTDLSITWEAIHSIVIIVGRKSKGTPYFFQNITASYFSIQYR